MHAMAREPKNPKVDEEAATRAAEVARKEMLMASIERARSEAAQLAAQALADIRQSFFSVTNEVSQQLAKEIFDERAALRFGDLRSLGVQVADVEEVSELLKMQVAERRYDDSMPCAQVGDGYIPVSFEEISRSPQGSVYLTPNQKVAALYAAGLALFLAQRATGSLYGFIDGAGDTGDGDDGFLRVRIYTSSSGARLVYSPAYFLDFSLLGSPTSPVKGSVRPGRYVFGIVRNGDVTREIGPPTDIPPNYEFLLDL